jgi:hypothetical protein
VHRFTRGWRIRVEVKGFNAPQVGDTGVNGQVRCPGLKPLSSGLSSSGHWGRPDWAVQVAGHPLARGVEPTAINAFLTALAGNFTEALARPASVDSPWMRTPRAWRRGATLAWRRGATLAWRRGATLA